MSILEELNNYINAGRNVISIQCQLPERVRIIESICLNIQMSRHIPCYLWNLGQGSFRFITSKHENSGESNPSLISPLASAFPDELNSPITSPLDVIPRVAKCSFDCFFILEDLHSFLPESGSDMESRITAQFLRSQLINLAFAWADTRKYAILLGTQETELPPILSSIIPEFWNPLPHYQENVALLSELLPQMGLSRDSLSADSLSVHSLSANNLTTDDLTIGSLTTDNLTTDDLTIASLTTDNLTAASLTAASLSTDNLTVASLTAASLTAASLSTDNLTVASLTPNNLTTDDLTTDDLTTASLSTNSLTTDNLTTDDLTTDDLTTDDLTTDDLTTDDLTTASLTAASLSTDNLTVASLTTNSLTTDNLTTDNLTTDSLTAASLSTASLSTNNLTTNRLNTDNFTPDILTTDKLTTNNLIADIPQLALAAGGLSTEEIKSGLRLVKAQKKPLIQGLLDFKIQRLKAFNLSFTPRPNVGNFGGMDRIRAGINGIKKDYSNEARFHGIPLPKGWLLVGPPGTGKTFVSKFCASILEFPMIAVDTGAIASGGASYLRRLIDRIEASAPAVVYFDELDKLFPDSGQPADITQRQVLGLLLTWLQDKVSQTFVIATLNRLDSLPPELTRLGRFDEIFYVGFPQNGERKDILHLHLARFDERYKNGNSPMSDKDWRVIINQTVNFTGAELSILVEKAARKLFHELKRIEINLEELLATRREITPLFMRDTDRILRIENIAKGVATPCSSPDSSIYAPPLTTLWGKKNED
jgi:ATP-dependent 26S proteasome regulatory subunit/uncharacterized protein YjbI with pentapeptide repeats